LAERDFKGAPWSRIGFADREAAGLRPVLDDDAPLKKSAHQAFDGEP
jgi:hypothetical protein